jgi:uncharacterized membrane protein (Fun14 family)
MSLKLLRMIHVSTQDLLHDIGLGVILGLMLAPKDLFVVTFVCYITCMVSLKC